MLVHGKVDEDVVKDLRHGSVENLPVILTRLKVYASIKY